MRLSLLFLSGCVFITPSDIEAKRDAWSANVVDADRDSYVAAEDCDDTNPDIHPGADEHINGIDDDCDGVIDEGTSVYDDDGDGYCEANECLPRVPDGGGDPIPVLPGDCNDSNASVYPYAREVCDGIPNDCTSMLDETADQDGDGYSVAQGDPDDLDRTLQPTDVEQTIAALVCDIVRIPANANPEDVAFSMGCDTTGCMPNERPVHEVRFAQDLLVAEIEVTRAQWAVFLSDKNWAFQDCGAECPVTRVSWAEAMAFANAVNAHLDLAPCAVDDDPRTCEGWRLPTEAEWAWAARGTSSDPYAGSSNPGMVAWTADNSSNTLHPPRGKAPNSRGLYDMSGNVWEWTWDIYQDYPAAPQLDPVVWETASAAPDRVLRGGAGNTWVSESKVTRRVDMLPDDLAFRDTGEASDTNPSDPYNWIGFRLVRYAPR